MQSKLFIIGNGFDCMYGLPTSVSHFKDFLSMKKVYNETNNACEVLSTYGVYWNEFESDLAYIDIDEIADRIMEYPDYLSDHESDRDGCIINMEEYTTSLANAVSEALDYMIENAENELFDKECITKDLFNEGDQIITFNYTSTIEQLYDLPKGTKIYHIHGNTYENKIFGYCEPQIKVKEPFSVEDNDDDYYKDYYIEQQRILLNDFYKSFQKNYQFEQLKNFLYDECKRIKEIVVIGHSMGKVDSEYMEIIDRVINPKQWYVSQYNNDPDKNTLNEYSFADRIEIYNSQDLLK